MRWPSAAPCIAIGLVCGSLACAGTWDADRWASSRPELVGRPVGRLGDATPYVAAADDTLVVFLCRWPLDRTLGVSLPPDASSEERRLLERALGAWERVVPRLRFEEVEGDAPLTVRFRDGGEGASATTECALRTPIPAEGPLDARIVTAEVELRRGERDAWGRPIALTGPELLASATHELGHALGLQGHARRGGTVMVADVDRVRRIGRRLAGDGALDEPAMEALYAVPSGTVVERRPLAPGSTAAVDAGAARARARGAPVARIRVGDRGVWLRWGSEFELFLREPAQLVAGKIEFRDSLDPEP